MPTQSFRPVFLKNSLLKTLRKKGSKLLSSFSGKKQHIKSTPEYPPPTWDQNYPLLHQIKYPVMLDEQYSLLQTNIHPNIRSKISAPTSDKISTPASDKISGRAASDNWFGREPETDNWLSFTTGQEAPPQHQKHKKQWCGDIKREFISYAFPKSLNFAQKWEMHKKDAGIWDRILFLLLHGSHLHPGMLKLS